MPCENCNTIFHSRKSAPFIPFNGSRGDDLYVCIGCKQIWWQYDLSFHSWTTLNEGQMELAQKKIQSRKEKPKTRIKTYQ